MPYQFRPGAPNPGGENYMFEDPRDMAENWRRLSLGQFFKRMLLTPSQARAQDEEGRASQFAGLSDSGGDYDQSWQGYPEPDNRDDMELMALQGLREHGGGSPEEAMGPNPETLLSPRPPSPAKPPARIPPPPTTSGTSGPRGKGPEGDVIRSGGPKSYPGFTRSPDKAPDKPSEGTLRWRDTGQVPGTELSPEIPPVEPLGRGEPRGASRSWPEMPDDYDWRNHGMPPGMEYPTQKADTTQYPRVAAKKRKPAMPPGGAVPQEGQGFFSRLLDSLGQGPRNMGASMSEGARIRQEELQRLSQGQ